MNNLSKQLIRICHIISGDLWAGAEVMAFHLLKGLRKYGDLELSAILLNPGRLSDEIRGIGIPVEIFDENKLTFLHLVSKIRKAIQEKSPDIVHSHRYKENILAYLSSKGGRNKKLISTRHGLPESNGSVLRIKTNLISKVNAFLLSRRFNTVVAVSREVEKFLIEKEGCLPEKVELIHNGVEVPKTNRRKKPNNPFIIGSAGRFFPVKDYALMVEIAKVIASLGKNIVFKLAGDGPEKGAIFSLIKNYGLEETFKLEGMVHNMSRFYEELDLYLNTSLHEGIPISVLEAMGYSLPIVAPLVGGFPEIIQDGVQGFLIKSRDPKDFANRCISLYENVQLRYQMGKAARERVIKEFSVERMASRYVMLYRRISAE